MSSSDKEIQILAVQISNILKNSGDPYQTVEINDHEIKITSVMDYFPTDIKEKTLNILI